MKPVEKENKIYHQLFGHIPNTIIGRIAYILGKRATSKNVRDSIEKEVRRIKRIKWKSISFTMFKIFKPSARPRANTRMGFVRMYVPRAKENGEWAIDYLNKHPMKKITTPCKFKISFYEKTPSSFSLRDKVLAEMGYLRPWKRTGMLIISKKQFWICFRLADYWRMIVWSSTSTPDYIIPSNLVVK